MQMHHSEFNPEAPFAISKAGEVLLQLKLKTDDPAVRADLYGQLTRVKADIEAIKTEQDLISKQKANLRDPARENELKTQLKAKEQTYGSVLSDLDWATPAAGCESKHLKQTGSGVYPDSNSSGYLKTIDYMLANWDQPDTVVVNFEDHCERWSR